MNTREDAIGLMSEVAALLRRHPGEFDQTTCTSCWGERKLQGTDGNAPSGVYLLDPCPRCLGLGRLWFYAAEGLEWARRRGALFDAHELGDQVKQNATCGHVAE